MAVNVRQLRRDVDGQVKELTSFALCSLRASSSVFYWIHQTTTMSVVELLGPYQGHFDAYERDMSAYDPLNVERLVTSRKKVATMRQDCTLAPASEFERYRGYMDESRVVDVLDFVFWQDGYAFAGLGVLKSPEDPPFTSDAFDLAHSMQPYIESNLRRHPDLLLQRLTQRLIEGFSLTPREVEVTKLVCRGLTNLDVGEELGMGLGTVKTHLLHIFQKIGVENRSALVAWVGRLQMS